jgi:hypothetical protein
VKKIFLIKQASLPRPLLTFSLFLGPAAAADLEAVHRDQDGERKTKRKASIPRNRQTFKIC